MEHMPDLQTVYDALKCLYHSSDCEAKEKASKWLQALQQSIFGWRIGDLLLQQNCDLESGYFGAQTLRTKIQSSFPELPIESHVSLRDSLIHHLKETNEKTNSVIVTQLCLALADLTLQMISWTNPIDDMLRIFNEDQGVNQRYLWPLLELLTVIPEEIQFSRHLKLGANRRSEVKLLMSKSSTNVLRFLETTLQTPLEDFVTHHMRVLKCYKTWVGTQTAPVDIWGRSSVLVFAFDFLKSPQGGNRVHEAASDAVCALLEEQIECCNVPKHLSDFIVGKCKELRDAYSNAVVEEDSDRAMNYCRIFTFLCESQLYDIVGDNDVYQPERLDLIDILIACCEHPEYEVVEITFGFWYKLSEEIYQRNQDRLTEVFRRPIERLLQCLQKHAQIEPDHEGILDETDEFADFRRRIVDLVKDVAFIVGSTSVFRHCCLSLTGSSWEVTEAALFMMGAVARNLLPDESEVIPGVLQAILSLPHEAHICVRHTSLWLISEMPDWINHHPEYLDSVLNFLLGHLTDSRLTGIASSAIESICNVARDRLTKHFDGLLQIIKNMDAFPLSLHASINILKGVTTVLSRLPEDQIEAVLFEVCRPQVEPLKSLVNPTPNPEKGKPSDPAFWFDRLAAVFRHLNINTNGNSHPCQAVMIQIWPIFSEVLHKYESNQRICERLSRCLRFGLRSLGRFSSPVIGSIVKEITEVYARHQHSCFLYLGSILVDEYAGDKSCAQGFLTMLESFLGPACALLQKENGLRDNPDTVDDLFRLCTRLLQRYPTELLSSPLFSYLLQCSLMASSLDHRDACSSVMKFISEVVQCARPKPSNGVTYNDEDSQRQELVRNVISSQGALILTTLLNASIFQLSSYNTVDVADVIYSFASVDRENTKMLLTQTFATLPRTTPSGCVTATDEQMKAFLDKTVGATSSKDVTRALRDFVRLYR